MSKENLQESHNRPDKRVPETDVVKAIARKVAKAMSREVWPSWKGLGPTDAELDDAERLSEKIRARGKGKAVSHPTPPPVPDREP